MSTARAGAAAWCAGRLEPRESGRLFKGPRLYLASPALSICSSQLERA
jgi:hypothetical protein